jgi:hypothetical protein
MPRKVFTAGEVLTAANVNTFLADQSVMTFADSSARTTAIPTPVEGMITYLEDTKVYESWNGTAWIAITDPAIQRSVITAEGDLIVGAAAGSATRIAVGGNGQILSSDGTNPVWTTAPGGGGLTLISTTTLTGASVSLTSIPQTYKDLLLILKNHRPATNATSLLIRVNGDSNARYRQNPGSTAVDYADSSFFQSNMGTAVTNNTGSFQFLDYADNALRTTVKIDTVHSNSTTSTNANIFQGLGSYNQTDNITSLDLLYSTGNFSAGTALLYGVS